MLTSLQDSTTDGWRSSFPAGPVGGRCHDDPMSDASLERVHRRRLATQRLSSAGLSSGADVVRLLTCVQSQDAPLAAWSLGMRMPSGATYSGVLAEQRAGGWVRTHVLRPTWHFVAPEDLRWIQALTGPKVQASLAGRHRGLGLDDSTMGTALDLLTDVLSGRPAMTRRELAAAFAERRLPCSGEQMAHQLLVAELRAVICSGPPRGTEHTYVLVEGSVPPGPADSLVGDNARRELVCRFVAGHGPASDRDLSRWCTLTLTEIRRALDALGDRLESVELDGHVLWFDPSVPARTTRPRRGYLLPTFDEVCLTYAKTGFPRRDPEATRQRLLSEGGGGIIVVDGEDVGTWKRTVTTTGVRVRLFPDSPLEEGDMDAVTAAAEALAAFVGAPLELELEVSATAVRR